LADGTFPIVWGIIFGVFGVLQALFVGGLLGLFRKLIDFEHRLSVLEGISDERRSREIAKGGNPE